MNCDLNEQNIRRNEKTVSSSFVNKYLLISHLNWLFFPPTSFMFVFYFICDVFPKLWVNLNFLYEIQLLAATMTNVKVTEWNECFAWMQLQRLCACCDISIDDNGTTRTKSGSLVLYSFYVHCHLLVIWLRQIFVLMPLQNALSAQHSGVFSKFQQPVTATIYRMMTREKSCSSNSNNNEPGNSNRGVKWTDTVWLYNKMKKKTSTTNSKTKEKKSKAEKWRQNNEDISLASS